MRWQAVLGSLAIGMVIGIGLGGDRPADSVQLSDGTVYFDHPPRLDDVATTRDRAGIVGATYYFTLELPADAGEPLQQIEIQQQGGDTVRQRVAFDPADSFAFLGTRGDRTQALTFGNASFDDDTRRLTLTFDPPVSPGTTLTIGIEPDRNPLSEGVYLFGVTAFPAGEASYGQFLGYGRLHFYRLNDLYLR